MKPLGRVLAIAVTSILLAAPGVLQAATGTATQDLGKQVRHELLMLPYYGVFDNLEYKVEGNTVTLFGEVVRPTLKSDAAAAVRGIPGVQAVVNNIKVLPLSNFDSRIRWQEARAIFGTDGLGRYAMGANPSIHIIVDNGHVTLEGVVNNLGDKNLANIVANRVFGVFGVTNNLRVEKS